MSRRSDVQRPSTRARRALRDADSPLLDALFAEAPIGLAFWDSEFRYRLARRVLLNLIWMVLGGLVLALGYAVVALVMSS